MVGGANTYERMFDVSTSDARPSSSSIWSIGMSVLTVFLRACTSSGMRGMMACGSACSRSDSSTRCWRAARSKSFEVFRERA
jgi:hypothetical protein